MSNEKIYLLDVFIQPYLIARGAWVSYLKEETAKNRLGALGKAEAGVRAGIVLLADKEARQVVAILSEENVPFERMAALSEQAASQMGEALILILTSVLEHIPESSAHYVTIQQSLDAIQREVPIRREVKSILKTLGAGFGTPE